ncbi:MFS transporter, partial [Mesorhizobium sp. M7A.F.Ca.US.003.02.1.1]
ILLGAVVGGLLLDGMTVFATFAGSVVLAGLAIALIGNGRRLLKPGRPALTFVQRTAQSQFIPTGDRKCP